MITKASSANCRFCTSKTCTVHSRSGFRRWESWKRGLGPSIPPSLTLIAMVDMTPVNPLLTRTKAGRVFLISEPSIGPYDIDTDDTHDEDIDPLPLLPFWNKNERSAISLTPLLGLRPLSIAP
eukprot:gene52921-70761_t